MINIETWFPTFIGQEILQDHEKIAKEIVPICKKLQKKIKYKESGWVATLYQTCYTHNICKDKNFDLINNIIYQKVHEYIKAIGGTYTIHTLRVGLIFIRNTISKNFTAILIRWYL